ncbi:MAG: AAA family ATPase [Bacteroidaceae bacterium]|nr:AAA family ATPase [Bacteroidaceae bacterium]
MIKNHLVQQIKENFPYKPTLEQENLIKTLSDFMFLSESHVLFLLKGYAGTGKTSLFSALVRTLDQLQWKCVLLAPTGRAAKVFASYAGHPAYTIHKKIYRQRSLTADMGSFSLNDNLAKHTLFIVDEASMISNQGNAGSPFGSGCLLDDLINFVYSGEDCKLMLMGDTAQLPPVGEDLSPALYADALRGYQLQVFEATLTQVVRQSYNSGILWNATSLRHLIVTGQFHALPKIKVTGFADIQTLRGDALIAQLEDCYQRDGVDETIVICRSNKRANIYNNGIRSQILWRESELEGGDRLMIVKNNYYWTQQHRQVDFIANGEMAVVRRVRNERSLYGFRFADVMLTLPDYDDAEVEATVLLDTLHSEAPALTREENEHLFNKVLEDYADISQKRERLKKLRDDAYYNALQIKYAYAVTCHKAQGGQWTNVFIDQGYMPDDALTPDYFKWLYTAFTRATGTLYLVNYPKDQVE